MAGRITPAYPSRYAADPTGSGNADLRLQIWKSRRSRAQEYKQLFETQWVRYWRWYRNFMRPLTDPADWWRSNEAIPTTFKVIETLLPRYLIGMFDNPDWFYVEARQKRDEGYERMCEALLRATVEEMQLFPKMYEALKYTLIMGHAWGKIVWREEYTTRQVLVPSPVTDPETGEQMMGVVADVITEPAYDNVDFEWRPLDRIFPDPTGEGDWYIEEIDTTLDRLRETQDYLGVYDENELAMLEHSIPPTRGAFIGDSLSEMRQGTTGGMNVEYMKEPESTEAIPLHYVSPMRDGIGVKLWQCWGRVPLGYRGKDKAAWRLCVIADGKYVLRDEPSPTPDGRPPYFPIKAIPIPGMLYGDSILRWIGPLADQQTRLANMRLDEVFLGIWQQYLYRRNSVVSDNQLLMQPGGAIEVMPEQGQTISDTFAILPRRPVMPDAFTEDQYRQTQAEHAAAASDIMQGVSAQDRQTATEVERRLQQGNARHMLQTMWNDYTVKKELLERAWKWLQMRMTKPKMLRTVGEDFAEIDIASIQIPIDIVVAGGMFALSKDTRIQMDQELVQLTSSPVFVQYMKPGPILRRLLTDRGWKNPDAFVKTDQEIMLESYLAQMAQAGQQAMAGGAGGGGETQGGPGMAGQGPPGSGKPPSKGQTSEAEGAGGTIPQGGLGAVPGLPTPGQEASMVGAMAQTGGPPHIGSF